MYTINIQGKMLVNFLQIVLQILQVINPLKKGPIIK